MTFPLDWLAQLVASVVLLWGIGGAVARVALRPAVAHDTALLAPFFGFSAVVGISGYLGMLGAPIQSFAWPLMALGLVGLVIARRTLWCSMRHHWRVLAVCAAAYVFVMGIVIALGYLTTVGATIDALSYATRSEYLREAGLARPTVPVGQPFYGWVADHIERLRVGDVYFVGVIGAITGLRSYQLLTTIAGLFFALVPASIYLLGRRTLRLSAGAALLAAALAGIHNLLVWVVYDNFLSQAFAMCLFVMLLYAEVEFIDHPGWRELLLFSLPLSGLISVYPIYALPLAITGVVYGAVVLIRRLNRSQQRRLHYAGSYVVWGMGVVLLAGLWNMTAVTHAYKESAFIGTILGPDSLKIVGPGNIFVFVPTFVMAGLAAHPNVAYSLGGLQLPRIVLWLGVVTSAAVCVVGWWRLPREKRLLPALALLVLAALAAQQRYGVNPPQGFAYGYFKLATLLVIVLLPLLAAGVCALWQIPRARLLTGGFLVAFVAANLANSLGVMWYVAKSSVVVNHDMIGIQQGVSAVPADEWLWLDLQPGLAQNWIGYLLKDRHIHYREQIALWFWAVQDKPNPEPQYRYALIQRSVIPERMQATAPDVWYRPGGYEVVWSNPGFELRRRVAP